MLILATGCGGSSQMKKLDLPDGSIIEYVEVRDEPLHRHEFENSSARLYDVLIPPGVTTLYHRHSQNTIYLTISQTKIHSRIAGSMDTHELEFLRGSVSFNPQRENPFLHTVTNAGQTDTHFVGVELYETGRTFEQSPFQSTFYSMEIENPHVRVYRLILAPGESTGLVRYNHSGFTIALTSGRLKIVTDGEEPDILDLNPADWLWHEGPLEQTLTNTGKELFEAVVYKAP